MRTLASLGIFSEAQGRRFELNAAAQFLRSDAPGSSRVLAEIVGEGVVFDLPGVAEGAKATFDRSALARAE